MLIHGDGRFSVGFATGANNAGKFVFRLALRPISAIGSHHLPDLKDQVQTQAKQ